ncbi:hypothetical protein DTO212C5_4563 [Paecilomyces variotii]|nr:hypothetical protein DTO212C5_4563 [Paecilomyces variotii]
MAQSRNGHHQSWWRFLALGLAAIDCISAASTSSSKKWPYQTFRSVDYHPPQLKVTRNANVTGLDANSTGYLFITPTGADAADQGPIIISDHDSELIWQGPTGTAFGFQAHTFEGRPVISYWTGTAFPDPRGFGYGVIKVLDQSYQQIHQVSLPQVTEHGVFYSGDNMTYPSYVDIHENFVTDRGTILVTATNVTKADLTSVGGPKDGWLRDSLFYEIDIKTNKVVYRWSSFEHRDDIPINQTVETLHGEGSQPSDAFNYFHMNAVSLVGNNTYLVSSRYYCTIFLINGKDGSVIWRLQGKDGGDFKLGPDAGFCYQHNARLVNARFVGQRSDRVRLHLHDNANSYYQNGTRPTSGLLLELDLKSKEARTIKRFRNPNDPVYAISQGSYQPLRNGHVVLDHGEVPKIEEYDFSGRWIKTVQFAANSSSYRGFRQEWVGKPDTTPSLAACSTGNSTNLYMSWNGATEVTSWAIYSGESQKELQYVKSVPKKGFETSTTVTAPSSGYVQVEARQRHVQQGKKSLALSVLGLPSC